MFSFFFFSVYLSLSLSLSFLFPKSHQKTTAESRRLWAWIRGDPCSLRVFNFLIGIFLIASGGIGVFIETFNHFRFFQIGIMFYVSMFGWVFAALEIKSQLCSTKIVAYIEKYIGCLTTATGRSFFLAFSGLLCFSAFDPNSNGWTEIVAFICGGCCFVLAIINLIIGCCAEQRLKEARSNIAGVEQLREKFDEWDLEMNGSLFVCLFVCLFLCDIVVVI